MIYIDFDCFHECIQLMNQHHPYNIESKMNTFLASFYGISLQDRTSIESLSYYAHTLNKRYRLLHQHLINSLHTYETLERNIQKEAGISDKQIDKMLHTNYFHTSTYHHTSISDAKSLYSYWKNGVCVGGSIAFSAIDTSARYQSKYINANASADVLQAKASIDGKLTFTQDGKAFSPAILVSGKGSVSLLQTSGFLSIGSSKLHADIKGNVGVGVAYAEGKAVLSSNEVTLKGKIGASALEVSGKGSISILGVTISVSTSANVGSIGAGAQFSLQEGKLSFGANASLLAGVGVQIDIDYE